MGSSDFVKRASSEGGKVSLSDIKGETNNLQGLGEKELREIALKRHEIVDKASLEGKTMPISSIIGNSNIEEMSEEARKAAEKLLQKLRDRYGDELPVNTAFRISCESGEGEKVWSDYPGCHEQHLRRRDGSIFFPPDRRVVTVQEIFDAQDKDRELIERFRGRFGKFTDLVKELGDNYAPKNAHKLLQESQVLLEELAVVGGPFQREERFLIAMERSLMESLAKTAPDEAADLEKIRARSYLARIPFIAQTASDHRPIPDDEVVPALLAEEIDCIGSVGKAGRAFGPDFVPTDADIRKALDAAVERGYSKATAGEILAAWGGGE